MTIRSANLAGIARNLPERLGKDPRLTARLALGLLLVANLVAAAAVFRPWGGRRRNYSSSSRNCAATSSSARWR